MAAVVPINDALHTEGASVTGAEARLSQASLWARTGPTQTVRTGVVYAGAQNLITGTAGTAPMTVTVAGLHFVGSKATSEGVYVGASTGVTTLDIGAAPGAGTSRIDVVYVMQRDLNSTTAPDGLTQGELGVIPGTPGVTPAKPAVPTGAVEVGTVQVASGVTATTNAGCTITTTCRWAAVNGTPLPVRGLTERNALTAYLGLQVLRLDTALVERYDGSTWVTHTPVLLTNPDSPIVGTYDATKPTRIWTINRSLATDGNGDGVLIPLASITPGCVLAVSVQGASTFEISTAARNSAGNLTLRVWAGTTLAISTAVALTGFVIGQ